MCVREGVCVSFSVIQPCKSSFLIIFTCKVDLKAKLTVRCLIKVNLQGSKVCPAQVSNPEPPSFYPVVIAMNYNNHLDWPTTDYLLEQVSDYFHSTLTVYFLNFSYFAQQSEWIRITLKFFTHCEMILKLTFAFIC